MRVPAVFMRGGTSNAVVFDRRHLPDDEAVRELSATMRRFCASLHRRRGESTSRDPASNFRVLSAICDRVSLTRGQSRLTSWW